MITNQDLIDYVEVFCQKLKLILNIENWHVINIEFKNDTSYSYTNHNRPDFSIIIDRLYHRNQLPFLKNFSKKLEDDLNFRQHIEKVDKKNGNSNWFTADNLLLRFIKEYLYEVDSFEIDYSKLKEMTLNFENSLKTGIVELSHFAIIRGANRIEETITIDDNTEIRSLSKKELSKLIEFYPDRYLDDSIPGNSCIMESKFKIGIFENQNQIQVEEKFKNIINTLRIIKNGIIGFQVIYRKGEKLGNIKFGYNLGWSSKTYKLITPINTFDIRNVDWKEFSSVYLQLNSDSIPNSLKTSIRRLDFAESRYEPNDKLIDLIISLEAIYGDTNGAINYKIGIRACTFLYTDFENRKKCFDLIYNSYQARNSLVHGGKKKKNVDFHELTRLVRLSIKRQLIILKSEGKLYKGNDFDKLIMKSNIKNIC